MNDSSKEELIGKVFTALLGSLCALVYGLVIATVIGFITGEFIGEIVGWTVAIFTVVGFFFGNVILDACLIIVHFLYGFANGAVENWRFAEDNESKDAMRAISIVGFLTGLILLLAFYVY